MYKILSEIAHNKGFYFEYGRRDYQNLYDEMDLEQVHIFLDPVEIDTHFDDYNIVESFTYSGSFMMVVRSEFDQNYPTKYAENIKPLLDDSNKDLLDTFACLDISITQWRVVEVINVLDEGFDGLLIEYTIEENV